MQKGAILFCSTLFPCWSISLRKKTHLGPLKPGRFCHLTPLSVHASLFNKLNSWVVGFFRPSQNTRISETFFNFFILGCHLNARFRSSTNKNWCHLRRYFPTATSSHAFIKKPHSLDTISGTCRNQNSPGIFFSTCHFSTGRLNLMACRLVTIGDHWPKIRRLKKAAISGQLQPLAAEVSASFELLLQISDLERTFLALLGGPIETVWNVKMCQDVPRDIWSSHIFSQCLFHLSWSNHAIAYEQVPPNLARPQRSLSALCPVCRAQVDLVTLQVQHPGWVTWGYGNVIGFFWQNFMEFPWKKGHQPTG